MHKLKNTSSSTRAVAASSPPLAAWLFFIFLAFALIFAVARSPLANAQTGTPTAAVESVVNEILGILRKPDFDLAKDGPAISAKVKSGFDSCHGPKRSLHQLEKCHQRTTGRIRATNAENYRT